MAEAQQVPTLRQERLAEALLDPTIKTKKDAALKAGYSLSTALKQPGRVTGGVGTQTALRRKEAERTGGRDKARRILSKGLEEMERRLPDAQDAGVAAFTKVASDVVAAGTTDDADAPILTDRARNLVKRYGRYCYYLGTTRSGGFATTDEPLSEKC